MAPASCAQALAVVVDFKRRNAALIPSHNGDERPSRVQPAPAIAPLAQAFAALQAPLALCDRFFGAETALYTSLYFERGSERKLHRDTPYSTTRTGGRYLGVWLAREDVDTGNGPLLVVPGSHPLPPTDVEALARETFPDGIVTAAGWAVCQDAVAQQCAGHGLAARELHVSRGEVIVWHPEPFHGGAPHRQRERNRNCLVMHVTPLGTPVHSIELFFDPRREPPETAPWV